MIRQKETQTGLGHRLNIKLFCLTNSLRQRDVISDTLDSNWLIELLMTIRLGTHLSPTISTDTTTLHVCKQQQIASGKKKVFCDTLISNRLMAVPMTIRLGTHVSLTITSDATTFQPSKQLQITSGNELLLVIL